MTVDDFFSKYIAMRTVNLRQFAFRQIFVTNPIFSLLFTFLYGSGGHLLRTLVLNYFVSSVVSCTIAAVLFTALLFDKLLRRRRRLPPRKPQRLWWFIISLCTMPFGLYLASSIATNYGHFVGLQSFAMSPDTFKTATLIGGLTGGVFFATGVFFETKRSLRELENKHLQAQISALTAQMNPHLLFNALNTVASLIASDPSKAEETVVTLSDLYRGVLNSSKTMKHSLSTELDLCQAYLKIEKARFGERVQSHFEVPSDLDGEKIQIPSLCVQPLVENAVKHGLSKKAQGGSIWVKVSQTPELFMIQIEDDGVGFAAYTPEKGTGTGLKNCRDRIHLHYGEKGRFEVKPREGGGTVVTITIPNEPIT